MLNKLENYIDQEKILKDKIHEFDCRICSTNMELKVIIMMLL